MIERYSIFDIEERLKGVGERLCKEPAVAALAFDPGPAHSRTDDDVIALLAATRDEGAWHINMRSATATMVGRGYPDAVIHGMARAYGRVDHPPKDPDVQKLIDGARAKNWGLQTRGSDVDALFDEISAPALMALEIEPLQFLVDRIVPVGTLLMIAGRPKIGKSFMALQLAWAVASGGDFLGHQARAGQVVYVANEDSKRRLQGRIQRMFKGERIPPSLTLGTNCPPLDDLRFQVFAEKIVAERPALVIIDTWQSVRGDGAKRSGTSYEADHAALRPYAELARESDTTILLIHHLRKATGFDDGDPFEAISGSNAILGTVDGAFILKRDGQGRCVLIGKGRDLAEIELVIEPTDQMTWRALDLADAAGSETERRIMSFLAEQDGEVSAGEIIRATELPESAVYQMLRRLAERGGIQRTGYGKYRCIEREPPH